MSLSRLYQEHLGGKESIIVHRSRNVCLMKFLEDSCRGSYHGKTTDFLNIYLNGYDGKLTAKNWSKLAEVSLDTATRDVKDLVAKGILSPIQGRVRDISYTLNYIAPDSPNV